jgi:hypothetical protein
LPEHWTEKIFRVMENRYRAKWLDSFGGIPRERVRQAWGEELAGLSGEEIARGLAACGDAHPTWPPEVLEFMRLCRPPVDAKADWTEAREQMAVRMRGQGEDRWSRPQVYWAAVTVGNYDLQTFGWETVRHRWERALAAALDKPVPEYMAPLHALPKPGEQCVTREVARQRSSLLARQVSERAATTASNAWAVALLRREAAGEQVELVAEGAWREVLGFAPGVAASAALRELEARAA